jgi:hypothetical protein
MAKYMNKHLSNNLKVKVEEQKHTDFVSYVEKGGRLSMKDLKNLNSVYKADYIEKILDNDT